MQRCVAMGVLLLLLSACASGPEQVAPLPDKVGPQPYMELLDRARKLGLEATAKTYVDDWMALRDTAEKIERTAKFMPAACDVPPKHKEKFVESAESLTKWAKELNDAALAKDKMRIDDLLTKINRTIRDMKPAD